MQIRRDTLGKIRSSLGALAGHAGDGTDVYARATPRRAEITENYYVVQELSRNRSTTWGEDPTGQIHIEVPYDGHRSFPRPARDDVARRINSRSEDGEQTAIIGHLLLHDHEKTDLRGSLYLHDTHGVVPVKVLVPDGDDLDELTADKQTGVIDHDFKPQPTEIIPAQLSIGIYDPDSLELPTIGLLELQQINLTATQVRAIVQDVIRQIKRQVKFRNELLLRVQVTVALPVKPGQAEPKLEVTRVAIGWPTITSLQTLSLSVGGDPEKPDTGYSEVPVRYNPVGKCLEWEKVRMFAEKRKANAKIVRYQSAVMLLYIGHPGELYEKDELEVHAEVEVSGCLPSGLEARLYDATGHKQDLQPKLTAHIHANARLMLSEAFAKRTFSPLQHLFFDEIVPKEDRIDDIFTVLHDAGFHETIKLLADPGEGSGTATWLLAARHRKEIGPMELWILVEGSRFTVERVTRIEDLGYRVQVPTGTMQIYMRGTLAGDHAELARAMNGLQQTLRERFAPFHVRA